MAFPLDYALKINNTTFLWLIFSLAAIIVNFYQNFVWNISVYHLFFLNWYRKGARLPIHKLRSKWQVQLCRDVSARSKSCWTSTQSTEGLFFSQHYTAIEYTNSDGDRSNSFSWIPSSWYQAGILCLTASCWSYETCNSCNAILWLWSFLW